MKPYQDLRNHVIKPIMSSPVALIRNDYGHCTLLLYNRT